MKKKEIIYIGIGSNLNNPKKQVLKALIQLQTIPKSKLLKVSSLYQSSALGYNTQNDYINAVVAISSELTPVEILYFLQKIENQQNRIRDRNDRWIPRTIDLDIILFGKKTLNNSSLTIPHYHMHARPFVLYPLLEINPNIVLPNNTPVRSLIKNCPFKKIIKI